MLDERGVEWRKPSPEYWVLLGMPEGDSSTIVGELSIEEAIDGTLVIWNATPEQAIEATLGRETCHDLGGTDSNGQQVFKCDKCGCVLSLYDRDGVNTLCTRFVFDYPRFCPECGRKVVAE